MASNTPITFDGTRYIIRGIEYEKTYGIVVFLDALGVKRVWEKKNPAEALKDWDEVYYTFSNELKSLSGVSMSAFSDTLIISMRGHRELITQPWKFVELLCKSITPAFVRSMHYEFFFRGVIVMGDFYRSPRMLIGPAVDEAAKFYEMSDWIGISLTINRFIFGK